MMKLDKDWIKKLDDKSLEFLLNHDEAIEKAPESLKYKVFTKIDNLDFKKEKTGLKNILFRQPFKIAFASISLILIMVTVFSLLFFRDYLPLGKNTLISRAENIEGNIVIERNDKARKIKEDEKIRINDIVKTAENSKFDLNLSNNSIININENTNLKIIQYQKKDKKEFFDIMLNKGKIICDVKLPTKESRFMISTATSRIVVKGTIFSVEVMENDDVKVEVIEGSVWIEDYVKTNEYLDKIKNVNNELYNNLNKYTNRNQVVSTSQSIFIEKKHVDLLNENYNKLSEKIYSSIKDKSSITDDDKKVFSDLIINFEENEVKKVESQYKINPEDPEVIVEDNTSDTQDESDDEENMDDSNFNISKLKSNMKLFLSEKYTAVSSNGKNRLLITSDSKKAVYCVDLKNGNLLWQFKNDNLKKLTSAAVYFGNMIVISSPERIFILNGDGSIFNEKKIENGPIYWAAPVISKNKIFIPVSGTVYRFDGKKIIELNNIERNGGQVYLTTDSDNLIFTDLNERNLNCYSLEKNEIILSSDKFSGRSFISPVISGNYIYTADSTRNIYKYNKELNSHQILDVENGITSNLIIKNNKLYFVGINGMFCSININSFNSFKRISLIEKNPSAEKFFTKKIISYHNYIFYPSDNGKIYYYDVYKNKGNFAEIKENANNNPLIGSPIRVKDTIYFIDVKSNIYTVNLK